MMGRLYDELITRSAYLASVVNGMGGPYFDRESYSLRETAWPVGLKPIPARVWAKLPQNKRAYIIKTLPSCGRA